MPCFLKRRFLRGCKAVFPIVLGTFLITEAAYAFEDVQHPEKMQEREACTPDVLRLCRSSIPNRRAITDCLLANTEHLTPACHEVMIRGR